MYAPERKSAPERNVSAERVGDNAKQDQHGPKSKHSAHGKGNYRYEYQLKHTVICEIPVKSVAVVYHTEGLGKEVLTHFFAEAVVKTRARKG